jgi:hypothetical protein
VKVTGKVKRPSIVFPSAARRMDTLNDLLAASDLVSLHCALTNDTTHILNAERLQHIKPGKICLTCFLVFSFCFSPSFWQSYDLCIIITFLFFFFVL